MSAEDTRLILQKNLQNIAPLYGHKPGSPLVSRLINKSAVRQTRPQSDVASVVLSEFHELIQSGLLPPLVGNFLSVSVCQYLLKLFENFVGVQFLPRDAMHPR